MGTATSTKLRLMGSPSAVAAIVEALRGCAQLDLTDPHGPLPTREGNRGGRWVRVYFAASVTGTRCPEAALTEAATCGGKAPA